MINWQESEQTFTKKFQDGNSVIEVEQLLENLVYDGKMRFAVRKCLRT